MHNLNMFSEDFVAKLKQYSNWSKWQKNEHLRNLRKVKSRLLGICQKVAILGSFNMPIPCWSNQSEDIQNLETKL